MHRPIALGAALSCLVAFSCTAEEVPTHQSEQSDHTEVAGPANPAAFDEAVWTEIMARCTPPASDEPILYSDEFHWGYGREEMAQRFEEIYASGMRLSERAFYDPETESFQLRTSDTWGGWVTLPRRLVENVSFHIERGLERGYVDHVFFPDMGHSHLFIPQDIWEAEYEGIPVSGMADRWSKMFDDPNLLMLYHTAEQLQMLDENDKVIDDRWIQWRFHTRNLVGDNAGLGRLDLLREDGSKANTARDMPGYKYFSAGFNISASAQGCFPYEHDGEIRWFDISLSDLPYRGGDDSDEWGL